MDLEYFEEHIREELEGAKDYIKRAIELKGMDANWSKTFYNMSLQETDHARQLFKLYEEYVKIINDNLKSKPEYVIDSMECMIDDYSSMMSELSVMQNIYKE